MNLVYEPGDNPADVLERASCVVAYIAESMELAAPGTVSLTERAACGLALITQTLSCDLRQAAADI